jgi:hypothetical protein
VDGQLNPQMTGFRPSPSIRKFLLWTARLALVAYLVQLVAIDHWHTHPGEVYGIEGTAAHAAHCHGAGDCSDGGAAAAPALLGRASLPVPPAPTALPAVEGAVTPDAAYAETPLQPPRAAWRAAPEHL